MPGRPFGQAALLALPEECCHHVFRFLDLRDVMAAASTCQALRAIAKDDTLWKAIAEIKWGGAALQLGRESGLAGDGHWFSFCQHRICLRSSQLSPLELVQERYPDPWKHLVCCLLCSRTTGGAVVRRTIDLFFVMYPTPSALLQADIKDVQELLDPVGLQETRRKAVLAMTHSFFAEVGGSRTLGSSINCLDWKDPSEFKGCGSFASESWQVFCCGQRNLRAVTDIKLRAYLRWLKSGRLQPARPKAKSVKKDRGAPTTRTLRSGRRR